MVKILIVSLLLLNTFNYQKEEKLGMLRDQSISFSKQRLLLSYVSDK